MRDFVPVLVEELSKYNNRLETEEAINEIFADFYVDQNIKILDEEYSFIIRHITTATLRAYFDKLANKHNNNMSYNKERLHLVLHYPIILDKSEQEAYKKSVEDFKEGKHKIFDIFCPNVVQPWTLTWIRTETDENWEYKGPDDNLREDIWDPEQLICTDIHPMDLQIRIGRRKAKSTQGKKRCCICHEFKYGSCYIIDNVHYNVCHDCMSEHYFPR